MTSRIELLPEDILGLLATHLSYRDVTMLSMTCKTLCAIKCELFDRQAWSPRRVQGPQSLPKLQLKKQKLY
jgi:hypothetical protein